jgi:hypothetical protein
LFFFFLILFFSFLLSRFTGVSFQLSDPPSGKVLFRYLDEAFILLFLIDATSIWRLTDPDNGGNCFEQQLERFRAVVNVRGLQSIPVAIEVNNWDALWTQIDNGFDVRNVFTDLDSSSSSSTTTTTTTATSSSRPSSRPPSRPSSPSSFTSHSPPPVPIRIASTTPPSSSSSIPLAASPSSQSSVLSLQTLQAYVEQRFRAAIRHSSDRLVFFWNSNDQDPAALLENLRSSMKNIVISDLLTNLGWSRTELK